MRKGRLCLAVLACSTGAATADIPDRANLAPSPDLMPADLMTADLMTEMAALPLVMMPSSLPYSMQACADPVTLPVSVLREAGFTARLIAALGG